MGVTDFTSCGATGYTIPGRLEQRLKEVLKKKLKKKMFVKQHLDFDSVLVSQSRASEW